MVVDTCSLNCGRQSKSSRSSLHYIVQDPPGLCESQKAKQRGKREGWLLSFLV